MGYSKQTVEGIVQGIIDKFRTDVCLPHHDRVTRLEADLDDGLKADVRELKEDFKKLKDSMYGVWWKIASGVGFLIATEVLLKVVK